MAIEWEPTALGDFVAPEHRPKRTKYPNGTASPSGSDAFGAGSIVRVKVRNFITYSIAEFHLGPTLNMIIGPNGTGKSTLVSALCLGLGGNEKLVSRKDMKSMIKINEERASIEIELKNTAGLPNVVVRRTFDERKSAYRIDGREASEKAVKAVCSRLNIQLDNLCQFLPQERVAHFAQMSPEQLLKETERSVGTGDLYTQHQALVELDQDRVARGEMVAKAETDYETLMGKRDAYEEEAQKYKEYEVKRKELEIHQKILPYARLQDKMVELKALKAHVQEAKQNLAEFRENKRPFVAELETQTNAHAQAARTLEEATAKGAVLQAAHLEAKKAAAVIGEAINARVAQRESLLLRALKAREQLAKGLELQGKLEARLQELQTEAATITDNSEAKTRRDALHAELQQESERYEEAKSRLRRHQAEQDQLRQQEQAVAVSLTSTDRIGVLDQTKNRDFAVAKEAHLCLRNRSDLAGRYWECPLVVMSVKPEYARALETVVDLHSKVALTMTKDSYDEVAGCLRKAGLNTALRTIGGRAPVPFMDASEVRAYGFEGFVSDFVLGPPEVWQMLCETSSIHKIPISSTPLSDEQLRRLKAPTATGAIAFRKFIAGGIMYVMSKSNYGSRQIVYRTQRLSPFNSFSGKGISDEQRQRLEAQAQRLGEQRAHSESEAGPVREAVGTLERRCLALQQALAEAKSDATYADQLAKNIAKFEDRVTEAKRKVSELQEQLARDNSGAVLKCEAKLRQLHHERLAKAVEAARLVRSMVEADTPVVRARFALFDSRNKVVTLNGLLEGIDAQRALLESRYREAREAYTAAKQEDMSETQTQREALSAEDREYMGTICKVYLDNGELTVREILKKIAKIEGEIAMFTDTSQSAITALRDHLEAISRLEIELPRMREHANAVEEEMRGIQTLWEPRLDALVAQISERFASTFTKVASAGEVRVFKAKMFKDWRMEIMVKFRDESEFAVLDSHVQSGGERAVSTIFFMMALQGATSFPFRVVDEINQGMDPRNEKIVHRHLVETACAGESTAQYFLVTPKLLQGLYYHPSMRLHCIVTGPQHEPINDNPADLGFGDLHRYVATA